MTQDGETEGMTASDHVKALLDHSGPGLVDLCLCNSAPVRPGLVERCREEDAAPIVVDRAAIEALGVEAVTRPLASETLNYARHSFARLAEAVMETSRSSGPTPRFFEKGRGTMSFSSEVKAELCPDGPLPPLLRPGGGLWSAALLQPVHRLTGAHQHRDPTPLPPGCPPCSTGPFSSPLTARRRRGRPSGFSPSQSRTSCPALWSAFGHEPAGTLAHHINFAVLEEEHCRLAFFRGAFLAGGSVTDPAKRYHLELSTPHLSVSRELRALLLECGFTPKETTRKANSITYFKQSEAIEDFLTAIGAPLAAMEIMNAKAEKDLRGQHQPPGQLRRDAALDLDKAVDAAQGRRIEAIYRLEGGGTARRRSCPTGSRRRWICGWPTRSSPWPSLRSCAEPPVSQLRVQPPPAQADGDGPGRQGGKEKERVDCHGEASGSKALEADFLGPYGGGCVRCWRRAWC